MNSVTDNYHFLCFGTITQVKVISGHQGKKVKQKNQDFQSINQSVYSKPSTVWLLGFHVRYKITNELKEHAYTKKSLGRLNRYTKRKPDT